MKSWPKNNRSETGPQILEITFITSNQRTCLDRYIRKPILRHVRQSSLGRPLKTPLWKSLQTRCKGSFVKSSSILIESSQRERMLLMLGRLHRRKWKLCSNPRALSLTKTNYSPRKSRKGILETKYNNWLKFRMLDKTGLHWLRGCRCSRWWLLRIQIHNRSNSKLEEDCLQQNPIRGNLLKAKLMTTIWGVFNLPISLKST